VIVTAIYETTLGYTLLLCRAQTSADRIFLLLLQYSEVVSSASKDIVGSLDIMLDIASVY